MKLNKIMSHVFAFLFGCLVAGIIVEKTTDRGVINFHSFSVGTDSLDVYTISPIRKDVIPLVTTVYKGERVIGISSACYTKNGELIYQMKTSCEFENIEDSIKAHYLRLDNFIEL